MKNNMTFFTLGLIVLSAQAFASAPAPAKNHMEGQSGAMPTGVMVVSSSSAVKIYKDKETQTEISAQSDAQIKAQLRSMISLVNSTYAVLKELERQAEAGDKTSGVAILTFAEMLSGSVRSSKEPGVDKLYLSGLVRSKNVYGGQPVFLVHEKITSAFKAEGLIE